MAITQETVNQAADSITSSGKTPTLANVRAITGGSFSTLTPLLQAWKAAQATQVDIDAVTANDLPSPLADRLAALGREVWAVALAAAQARFDSERATLQVERDQDKAAMADALAAADLVAVELEGERMTREREAADAAHRIAELEHEIKALQGDLAVARIELASSQATVAVLERQGTDFQQQLLTAIRMIGAGVVPGEIEADRKRGRVKAD